MVLLVLLIENRESAFKKFKNVSILSQKAPFFLITIKYSTLRGSILFIPTPTLLDLCGKFPSLGYSVMLRLNAGEISLVKTAY